MGLHGPAFGSKHEYADLDICDQVQSSFQSSINFVALNIDNTKWTDEVSQYRVRGVPHFVFLDGHGRQQAAAVGRVPQQVALHACCLTHCRRRCKVRILMLCQWCRCLRTMQEPLQMEQSCRLHEQMARPQPQTMQQEQL